MLRNLTIGPIKWRLTIAYVAIIYVVMTSTGLVLSYLIERQFTASYRRTLTSHAMMAKSFIEDNYHNGILAENPNVICRDLSSKINSRVQIFDSHRKSIGDSHTGASENEDSNDPTMRFRSPGCRVCHPEVRSAEELAVIQPVVYHGQVAGYVRVSSSSFAIKQASAQSRRIIFLALIFAAILAAALSSKLAASIARPITHMGAVAKKMAEGDLSQRVSITSSDEIGQLATGFNTMALQIEKMLSEIAEDKNKMQTILTTMADGIIVMDETGRITLFNKASEGIFSRKESDVLGASLSDVNLNPDLVKMVLETLKTRRLVRKEIKLVIGHNDIFLSVYSSPVRDQSSKVTGAVLVLHDLTDIRRHEQAQKEFVGNVSHELRTPITAVRVTAEALLSGAKNDPALLDRFLTTLVRESERLSLLIDDLLEIARRESGNRKPRKSDVELNDLISRVINLYRTKADANNVNMMFDVPEDLTIYADERQLEQVLANLIDNAIKYTPQGGNVEVRAFEDASAVTISVADTGIGIPSAEAPRIFERFYRVDKARSRQMGGTGLGLSIVKDIVEAHNGTITVETELDAGSTFSVTIPRAKSAASDENLHQEVAN